MIIQFIVPHCSSYYYICMHGNKRKTEITISKKFFKLGLLYTNNNFSYCNVSFLPNQAYLILL